jgi:hypothetical protein
MESKMNQSLADKIRANVVPEPYCANEGFPDAAYVAGLYDAAALVEREQAVPAEVR